MEAQKADLEIALSKLKIAVGIRWTKKQIVAWLKTFCVGDLFDMDFRRRIIDVLVQSVHLYDDKLIIFYNVKDGKQVSHMGLGEDLFESLEDANGAGDVTDNKGVRISNDLARVSFSLILQHFPAFAVARRFTINHPKTL